MKNSIGIIIALVLTVSLSGCVIITGVLPRPRDEKPLKKIDSHATKTAQSLQRRRAPYFYSEGREEIIYFHNQPETMLFAVPGIYNGDGSYFIYQSDDSSYDGTSVIEEICQFMPIHPYYVFIPENKIAYSFTIESDSEGNVFAWQTDVHSVERLEIQIPIENSSYKQNADILINMDKKMRPQKPNSQGIVGTWVDVTDSSFRRTCSFCEDGTFTVEGAKPDKYHNHNQFYEMVNENIIEVHYITESLITGRVISNTNLYYYDGKYIYEVLYPLENISDNEDIKNAIINAK